MDLKLELVVLPVTDEDRSKAFYEQVGFGLDVDVEPTENMRVVQLTPPGSACSITIGKGLTPSAPGSAQGLHLVTTDIEAARAELVERGIDISEIFHFGPEGQLPGPDPERADYGSFASFSDPDDNGWLLQEVKQHAR
jgi:predicted enzyme related to lactoylglutathione lyase